MSRSGRLVKAGERHHGMAGGRFGDNETGSAVAMMMVTASGQVAGFVVAVGHIFMMLGMRVLMIMDGVDRETGRTVMVVRDHQSRRVLDLVRRFGRNCRRIEQHEHNAERGSQAVD